MNTFIALFRGINVGGHNTLPMKELASVLESIGLLCVRTYIQSGNVVFQSNTSDVQKLSHSMTTAVATSHGFSPSVLLLSAQALRETIAANPFPDGATEPKTLHLFFLASSPANPNVERLESFRAARENFRLIDKVLYLHAPDGTGRSKLAANVEKAM